LGDSITDGRGSTTNGNDRWPDALAERLKANAATARIGVLNQGIGGNAVLAGGLGPTAVARFEADVLKQSGVRYVIVFEGVNDIGASESAANLISAYQQFVGKARAANVRIFGATILPFKGHSHYSEPHEAARVAVNAWIRTAGNFDAVIDLDATARDPQKADTLLPAYDSGDHLHLTPAGYKQLANAVDLQLFQ
jgi:lysophospholipase L1-like esterase